MFEITRKNFADLVRLKVSEFRETHDLIKALDSEDIVNVENAISETQDFLDEIDGLHTNHNIVDARYTARMLLKSAILENGGQEVIRIYKGLYFAQVVNAYFNIHLDQGIRISSIARPQTTVVLHLHKDGVYCARVEDARFKAGVLNVPVSIKLFFDIRSETSAVELELAFSLDVPDVIKVVKDKIIFAMHEKVQSMPVWNKLNCDEIIKETFIGQQYFNDVLAGLRQHRRELLANGSELDQAEIAYPGLKNVLVNFM